MTLFGVQNGTNLPTLKAGERGVKQVPAWKVCREVSLISLLLLTRDLFAKGKWKPMDP